MPPILRSRAAWAVGIAAVLVGLYALAGFKGVPALLRSQASTFVRENYGRELALGEIRFNPFTLQLEMRDLRLPDADGAPMLGFERSFVDFEVASLWRRAYVFRNFDIDAPHIRAVVRPDGSVNLDDLALPPEPGAPVEPDEPLPAVWIQSLVVGGGLVEYVDRTRRAPLERRFEKVGFSLQDFRTTPEGGDFHLTARTRLAEQFDWKGRFALEPVIASKGEFTIAGLDLPGLAEFLGDALPFGVSAGTMKLRGTYDVALADALNLEAELPLIEASGIAMRARGVDSDWVQIPELELADTKVSLPEQAADVRRIEVNGLSAMAWMDAAGAINLEQLFAPIPIAASDSAAPPVNTPSRTAATPAPAGATPGAGDATAASDAAAAGAGDATSTGAGGDGWSLRIAEIELARAAVAFEDRSVDPVTTTKIDPLSVTIRDASLDLARPLPVKLGATLNDHAQLALSGTVTPEPLAADLDLTFEKARMQILQPYVLPLADLTITGGLLGVKGKLRLDPPASSGPELRFAGDVVIDGFTSIDNALKQDFITFRELRLKDLKYDMAPDALHIEQVQVTEPYARVIISKEQVLNIAAVIDPQGTAAALAGRKAAQAAEAARSPAEKRRLEKEQEAREKQAARAKKAGAVAPPPPPPEPAADEFPVRVREVRIERGRMSFADHFVQPNFSAEVQDLGGTIHGVSSASDSRARVDLKGNVGEFSPVAIAGELQPFAFERFTDMGLSFENISLPVFNPYSGRLAGYNIAKGKLTTQLHYSIQDSKLDADHRIRIDQLEWGEATEDRGEATLPVKFATSLLKDRHGVIDLDVPVTGTIDDPKFRIGPIVWQIIRNLIVKAVTAPFALLGSLFEGAEEAQFIDFAPGDATVPGATAGRLANLAKGLVERPQIRLDVPIGTVAELDRPALADRAFQRQLAAAIEARSGKAAAAGATTPGFEALEPRQRLAVLRTVLEQQGGVVPEVPEFPPPPEGASRTEAKAQRESAEIAFLEKEARARVVIAEPELEALGQERANAIQRALLAGGELEATRVFLARNDKVTANDGNVRFELGLQ